MNDDLEQDLVTAIDDRIEARKAAAIRRAEGLRQLRALRKQARDAGLVQRHTRKLRRIGEAEQRQDEQQAERGEGG